MTEGEWVACTRPEPMLRFLLGTDEPRVADIKAFPGCRASGRKLRLFACACYGRVRHLLPGPLAQAAVEVAERFADGVGTAEELEGADARLWEALEVLEARWRASRGDERTALQPTHEALALALQVTRPEAAKAAYYACSNAHLAAAAIANPDALPGDRAFYASQLAEERGQADLLRDVLGPLPFRPVAIDPAALCWYGGSVVRLARRVYEERKFEWLPVLADALEEAGCQDKDILRHCREQGGIHVRGCWCVDLVLGKQ